MTRLIAALILALVSSAASAQQRGGDRPGDFDFYVLSLSWSPTFCASDAGARSQQQCGSSKDFGFIVHGLWPQYERGYPQDCDTGGQDRVPAALGQQLFEIMPSMGLIGHEWRTHGSCSGLSQRAYFSRLRDAFQMIHQPTELTQAAGPVTLSPDQAEDKFVAANPGMSRRGISISCDAGQLSEVRICLTKNLQFRDCQEVDRGGCRSSRLTLPAR